MIKLKSSNNVSATLDRLESILKENSIGVVARVDHAAAAQKVEMQLRPTQVLFFGNPKLGTPLMQSNQLAGLDLPMRALAWEDDSGQTWLAYHSPQEIADNLQLTDRPEVISKLIGAMEKFTSFAAAT